MENLQRHRWTILVVLGIIAITFAGTALAQDFSGEFFHQTGHWISGEFYARYSQVENPEMIYGLPITDSFIDQDTGLTVQYFEYARFELDPDAPGEQRVTLTRVGEYTYEASEKVPFTPNPTACRLFNETHHWVCYEFLSFFEMNGGGEQFGYPISEFEFHNGYIAQYFEYARFEWHPEYEKGERVQLGTLGREYFAIRNEDPAHLHAQQVDAIPMSTPIEDLRLFVFVGAPITYRNGQQTYHIIVQDQNRNPVPNAQVALTIYLPDGTTEKFTLASSNADGLSVSPPLDIHSDKTGTANVYVTVQVKGIEASTHTSYYIWW